VSIPRLLFDLHVARGHVRRHARDGVRVRLGVLLRGAAGPPYGRVVVARGCEGVVEDPLEPGRLVGPGEDARSLDEPQGVPAAEQLPGAWSVRRYGPDA